MVSLVGTWMQTTAQQYLVYSLTGSTTLLGLVAFLSGVPIFLFTLFGGLFADRFSRRTLMLITQTTMMLLAFILAALVFLHIVQYWHILILATLLGMANAIDAPIRQSFVVELVDDRKDMVNAISLNATMFNLAVVMGPAVSGIVYYLVGPAWCFTINGISFIAVIIALALMRIPPQKKVVPQGSVFHEIGDGLRFVFTRPVILWLILSLGVISMIGFGFIGQAPAWATDVLKGDERTNGLMLTMRGIGSLMGALVVATWGHRKVLGRLWSFGSSILPFSLILFALIPWLGMGNIGMVLATYLLLIVLGAALMLMSNSTNAMVQQRAPDEYRGRVMSIYTLIFMGGMPIGSLIIGAVAEAIQLPATILIGGILMTVFIIAMWIFKPEIRKL
jgi:MFS family permease